LTWLENLTGRSVSTGYMIPHCNAAVLGVTWRMLSELKLIILF